MLSKPRIPISVPFNPKRGKKKSMSSKRRKINVGVWGFGFVGFFFMQRLLKKRGKYTEKWVWISDCSHAWGTLSVTSLKIRLKSALRIRLLQDNRKENWKHTAGMAATA